MIDIIRLDYHFNRATHVYHIKVKFRRGNETVDKGYRVKACDIANTYTSTRDALMRWVAVEEGE